MKAKALIMEVGDEEYFYNDKEIQPEKKKELLKKLREIVELLKD